MSGGVVADLSNLLVRIQVMRYQIQQVDPSIDARLVQWGVVAVAANHFPSETLACLLANRSQQGQWWVVRQLLPDEALIALEAKLVDLLLRADRDA